MFSAVTSEGLLSSGQSSASDSGPRSLSAGLTAQESPWIGLMSRPTMSLLRLLPARSRNLTDRVPEHNRDVFPHVEEMPRRSQDAVPGLQWLTGESLQELGVTTEPVPELQQLSPGGSVSGVRATVSHLLLGCRDRPSSGAVWASGVRGGPPGFRGEMWARNGLLGSEAAEPETPETSAPSQLLSTCIPPTLSHDGPPNPEPLNQPSPEEENLQAAPTPPQNMAIAFIMGFPCSDEDDGFDSEGSSSFSSSSSTSSSSDDDDDEGSERLLRSVGLTSDPYNPRCFTAPLHTGPTPVRPPAPPPHYSRDEAAERLDSGFSELPQSTKKVRFRDNVEEFICEAEDRRGRWEELARDRLRFQRRCQEAELQLAPCLQPQHRHMVYQRLHGDLGPDFRV